MKPPIIILGMHRSGTSILTNSLMRLGMFMGYRVDGEHDEAQFFVHRNEYLLQRAGAMWDDPGPLLTLLENPRVRDEAIQYFRRDVAGFQFAEFLGPAGWITKRPVKGSWGWKDPRTILTLPVWQGVFPGAKLLLIQRNGVDVAGSLHRRAQKLKESLLFESDLKKLRPTGRILSAIRSVPRLGPPSPGVRCTDLNYCYALWEQYVSEALRHYQAYPGEKMTIRYEDYLEQPIKTLRQVSEFCELPSSDAELDQIGKDLNRGRAYAFTSSNELTELYQLVSNRPLMEQFGYSSILTG